MAPLTPDVDVACVTNLKGGFNEAGVAGVAGRLSVCNPSPGSNVCVGVALICVIVVLPEDAAAAVAFSNSCSCWFFVNVASVVCWLLVIAAIVVAAVLMVVVLLAVAAAVDIVEFVAFVDLLFTCNNFLGTNSECITNAIAISVEIPSNSREANEELIIGCQFYKENKKKGDKMKNSN